MVAATPRRRLGDETGQALVELALVLPVLMFVIFGGIELTRGITYWLDANHVANETARWAAVNRLPPAISAPTEANFQSFATGALNSAGFPQTDAGRGTVRGFKVCLPDGASSVVGNRVVATVTLTWPLPMITSLAGIFGFSPSRTSIPIKGSSEMRLEQVPTYLQSATC
ncbi:MAG: TadE/TadG family type IV pilus assembly protein [Gaiellaceae bacterium]